jgi:hypothetical protein
VRRDLCGPNDAVSVRYAHGDLELTYETMALTANPGLTIAVFTAEPGSKSEQALNLLASWTATHEQPESAFTRPHG